jgi:hypothetical protein
MKLQIKRKALDRINRRGNEMPGVTAQRGADARGFDTVLPQTGNPRRISPAANFGKMAARARSSAG